MYSGIFSGTNPKVDLVQQPVRRTTAAPHGYKSQKIRDYLNSHPQASVVEIRQAMQAEGLQVSYGMAGQLRKEFRNRSKAASGQRGDLPRPAASCIMCTMEEWVRAQQLLRAFRGDVTRVVTALTMLHMAGYKGEEGESEP